MIDPQKITTLSAALIAGMVTSLHCVGMCGPLACAFQSSNKKESDLATTSTLYHLCRLLSYGLIGAVAGGIGRAPFDFFAASPARFLPWAVVLFFLMIGLGLEQKFPRPLWVTQLLFRARSRISNWSGESIGATLGFLTPLLPCGPLYMVFVVALLSGSALKGAEFTLAFGLGTVPLLWLAQHQFLRWNGKLNPIFMRRLQRGLALLVALMIGWRLYNGSMQIPAEQNPKPPHCPMCHPQS